VPRIWHAHGLKPHLIKTFKVSRDPEFGDKSEAIVGLCPNPPEYALVTPDYKRNGTATLFAALDIPNGEVFGLCQERHRHQEWLKSLR
jgi:hypothetical protein